MAGTDRPDWSRAVFIAGGNVVVSGTANVTLVGTPSVVVSGTANVAITNTPAVTIASGSVNIGSANTVKVINKTGTVIQTGDLLTKLGTHTFATPGTSFSFTVSTATKAVGALLVVVSPSVATPKNFVCASARYTSAAPAFCAPLNQRPGILANPTPQTIIPVAVNGAGVTVTVYALAVSAGNVKVTVWGLTSNPGVQMRPDGRAWPMGSRHIRTTALTVVAQPPSPMRMLVYSATLIVQAKSTGIAEVGLHMGTTGTPTTTLILDCRAPASGIVTVSQTWEKGLLCTPVKGIKVGKSATVTLFRALVVYDIVV